MSCGWAATRRVIGLLLVFLVVSAVLFGQRSEGGVPNRHCGHVSAAVSTVTEIEIAWTLIVRKWIGRMENERERRRRAGAPSH